MDTKSLLKKLIYLSIIILIAIGIFLRLSNLYKVTSRSSDEKMYTYHAKVIAREGPIAGTRVLVQEFNKNPEFWIYPTPVRIGYNWLLAAIMKVSKSDDVMLGSYVSFTASVLSLILAAIIGLRFFNPTVTLFAILFMSVSTPELAIARRTWQDAFFGFLGLLTIYYSLEIARNPKRSYGIFSLY